MMENIADKYFKTSYCLTLSAQTLSISFMLKYISIKINKHHQRPTIFASSNEEWRRTRWEKVKERIVFHVDWKLVAVRHETWAKYSPKEKKNYDH